MTSAPAGEIEDLRGEDAGGNTAETKEVLRPVMKTTLSRMRATAAAEAGRIEIVQRWLVESGQRETPSEHQLRQRDDYDAIVRLIDAVEASPDILARLVEMIRR